MLNFQIYFPKSIIKVILDSKFKNLVFVIFIWFNVACVLQEAGNADSRAPTRSQM